MKNFRKTIIIYYLLMITTFLVMLIYQINLKLTGLKVEKYSSEELATYKKVWNTLNDSLKIYYDHTLLNMFILWVLIMIISTVFIVFIYIRLVKPLKEMEGFSLEIARGNLDESLPIHKDSIMESFTESFDMMRETIKNSKLKEIEAEKSKKELVAEISHDIKTPVATISATCEVMEAKYNRKAEMVQPVVIDEKEINDTIEKIHLISDKTETINQLITNMFHATLEELETLEVNVSEVSSHTLMDILGKQSPKARLKIENIVPDLLVYMDTLRMEQVIDNVISNSVKYAGTEISVTFSKEDGIAKQNDKKIPMYLKITIRDYGPGADEEDISRLAEKYYRGKAVSDKQGYGLGLYLVDWYMKKQDGGMNYYNDNGFVVELLLRVV